jgi:hypothetical protein
MKQIATILITASAVLMATQASAQTAWGNDDGCRRHAGQTVWGDDLTIYTGTSVQFFESGCDGTESRALDKNGFKRLFVSCSGEGDTWTTSYDVLPMAGIDGFEIWETDSPQYITKVYRCQ